MDLTDFAALLGLLVLIGAVVAGCLLGSRYSIATAPPRPAVCYFDDGTPLTAGNAARTTDGHVWRCDTDGQLYKIK